MTYVDGSRLARVLDSVLIGSLAVICPACWCSRTGPLAICGRPPSRKRIWAWFDRIACGHMSGLLVRSHMTVGQDGFRDTRSKQDGDLVKAIGHARSLSLSWIDRSHHLLVSLQDPALSPAREQCRAAPRVGLISRRRTPMRAGLMGLCNPRP